MDKNDGIIFLRFVKGICPIYKILFLREISQKYNLWSWNRSWMNILIMNWIPLLYLKAGRKNGWIKNFGVRKMTKPVSLFEIVDHKYCKNCRQSTMWWNIEKWNIQLKNRKCIPSIEARSTERGYESIVKYCFFIVLVLIDTWWNVNYHTQKVILFPSTF